MHIKNNNKKAYALLVAIFLLILFSFLSIRIIENNSLSNNINKLKYFNIQANIHMKKIIKYINSNAKSKIIKLSKTNLQTILKDDRFTSNITIINKNSTSLLLFIQITYKDYSNVNIRLTKSILKK